MTVWAILDTTNTIVNIVDDVYGTVPVQTYVTGQTQIDYSTLPEGVWAGWQRQADGTWQSG